MNAVFAGYLQIVEVKKAMVNASATESITLDRGNGIPWNTTERHGTKSAGKKFHPEMLTQPSIKNQTPKTLSVESLIGTFKAGRISHLASRISHLMRFVMIKFKSRSGSHEAGN